MCRMIGTYDAIRRRRSFRVRTEMLYGHCRSSGLVHLTEGSDMNFFLGCAVWSYKGWVGSLYPPGSRAPEFLSLYSRRLTSVEGNTTFYAIPDAETLARWASDTPAGFRFCLKVPRDLSHSGSLRAAIPGALQFLEQMSALSDRLGPTFLQLPPGVGPEALDDLAAFLSAWPRRERPLAVEVRHPGFFQEPYARALNGMLESFQVGRVLLDTRPIYDGPEDPLLGSERKKPPLPLHPGVTAPFTLVRFISHPSSPRNLPYLEEWALRVNAWVRQGIQVYFFVHCPVEEMSPLTALAFQQQLEALGAPIPALPGERPIPSPTQLRLF